MVPKAPKSPSSFVPHPKTFYGRSYEIAFTFYESGGLSAIFTTLIEDLRIKTNFSGLYISQPRGIQFSLIKVERNLNSDMNLIAAYSGNIMRYDQGEFLMLRWLHVHESPYVSMSISDQVTDYLFDAKEVHSSTKYKKIIENSSLIG